MIIDLTHPNLNDTFPDLIDDEVRRENIIDTIKRILTVNDVLFLEGDSGIGKTVCLSQFVKSNPFNCISYFIIPSIKFSYNPISLKRNMFRQLYFYLHNDIPDETVEFNDHFLTTCYPILLKKLRTAKKDETLYFVFDSFADIANKDLLILNEVISTIPWTKAKVIFSGSFETLKDVIPPKIVHRSLPINYFSFSETKELFASVAAEEDQLREIYSICSNGMPEKLAQVKRLCKERGGVTEFLSTEINEKTNLFEVEWTHSEMDELKEDILALIAFDESTFTKNKIAQILEVNEIEVEAALASITFLNVSGDKITFKSDNHKRYAKSKLEVRKEGILQKLISFYETVSGDDSLFNLPGIYQKAKRWEQMVSFLTLDVFVAYLEKTQSFSAVIRQFEYGLDAARQFQRFSGDYLRFALHKSSIKELERHKGLETEIEARIAIGEYEEALTLANSAFLKEDRLLLLAILVKTQKEYKLTPDKAVLDQISDLYKQVDFAQLEDNAISLASTLLYSFPELAIDLVEKTDLKNADTNSVDVAFTYLSFYAQQVNKKMKSDVADLQLIHSKIKNDDLQNLAIGFKYLSDEYNAKEILEHVEKITSPSRQMYILRSWVGNNRENENVTDVIEYAINKIIVRAVEDVPNASLLVDFAIPLPKVKDKGKLLNIVALFDSQKATITTPTKDFVRTQLFIAEAVYQFDSGAARDRFFEIFLIIDEVKDLSIKTDCLCSFWVKLIRLKDGGLLEREIAGSSTLQEQVTKNFEKLFAETAYHAKIVDFAISALTPIKPLFVLDIICKLNTEERREQSRRKAFLVYISVNALSEFDFRSLNSLYSTISRQDGKEFAVIKLIEKVAAEKDAVGQELLSELVTYFDYLLAFADTESKCYGLVQAIKILSNENEKYKSRVDTYFTALYSSWNNIDRLWEKVDIGFSIARDLSSVSNEIAKKYLSEASNLRESYSATNSSVAATYKISIRLVVQALGGLVNKVADLSNHIRLVSSLIEQVQSNYEKLYLWKRVAFLLIENQRRDDFDQIIREYIRPIFSLLNSDDRANYEQMVTDLAPVLFYSDPYEAFFERINTLTAVKKNFALDNVFKFILSKKSPKQFAGDEDVAFEVSYEDCVNLCSVLSQMDYDLDIYDNIKNLVNSIRVHRLPVEQRSDIKRRLTEIINKKLPNAVNGVSHNGYLIISKAEVLSLDVYAKKEWDKLIVDAESIPNLSDRVFVFAHLAKIINANKGIKNDLLEKSLANLKQIPSSFDKFNRYGVCLPICFDLGGKPYFEKVASELIVPTLQDKDENIDGLRMLVDTAQQYDSSLAENIITLLDRDPARKKYKKGLEKRIEANRKVKLARSNFDLVKDLDANEVHKLADENLKSLQSGKYTSKDINETLELLTKISTMSLRESYSLICFFIQNAVKKYEANERHLEIMESIFKATYDNARLIDILTLDSITKMRNRHRHLVRKQYQNSPVIRLGEREVADNYLKEWIRENVVEELTVVDPYFTESDLTLVKQVAEVNQQIEVQILTSKENGNNCNDNNEVEYNKAWKSVSDELPPPTTVNIVWISSPGPKMKKSPFHDRWLLADHSKKGLKIGTSFNSLGMSKDSQISPMTEEELFNVDQTVIADYLISRKRRYNEYRLSYATFELLQEGK